MYYYPCLSLSLFLTFGSFCHVGIFNKLHGQDRLKFGDSEADHLPRLQCQLRRPSFGCNSRSPILTIAPWSPTFTASSCCFVSANLPTLSSISLTKCLVVEVSSNNSSNTKEPLVPITGGTRPMPVCHVFHALFRVLMRVLQFHVQAICVQIRWLACQIRQSVLAHTSKTSSALFRTRWRKEQRQLSASEEKAAEMLHV